MLMMTQLSGFGGGVSTPPPSVEFLQRTEDTTNLTNYSFAGQNLGAEDTTRRIVVVVHWGQSVNTRTLNSATINGVAATIHVQNGGSAATRCAIISALVPTGTSGTIALAFSGACDRANISVFRALNETSGSPTDFENDTSVTSGLLSVAIDVPAGGWVVAGIIHNTTAGSSWTWTGAVEDYEIVSGDAAGIHYTAAHQNDLAVQTGRTVSTQCTTTSVSNGTLVAITWG
jgi:hypothetical protein